MKLVKPILLIETGTALCSVSLAKGTSIITSRSTAEPRAHASVLAPFIDEILKECQITMKDCGAVAISGGPGSYTGLRVGCLQQKGSVLEPVFPLFTSVPLNSLHNCISTSICTSRPDISVPDRCKAKGGIYGPLFR